MIETVGTAGATTTSSAMEAGTTTIPVASGIGFRDGQTISIGTGANAENAVIAYVEDPPAPLLFS